MEVVRVRPSGFCKGVVNAIELCKKTRKENPNDKIYVLGMIVHNSYVTEELNKINIITLDDNLKSKEEWIDSINEGIVIFTAHGISDYLKNKVIDKKLRYIDATCEDVLKNKALIMDKLAEGYDIIYLGKKNHPEAEAIIHESAKIHLVSKLDDIDKLYIVNDKILLTNQTTMSYLELSDIIQKVRQKYPNILICDEICQATSSRQKAIYDLKDCELLYVVGDVKSNNTNMLKTIGEKRGIKKVRLISNHQEINDEDLKDVSKVYVTAGASTPDNIINEIINYLSSK